MPKRESCCSPETLRRLRIQAGWSISELAMRAAIGRAALSNIEAGKHLARPQTTRALAAALGVPPFTLHPDHAAANRAAAERTERAS